MPQYTYKDKKTNKEVDVFRSLSEYDVVPTQSEAKMEDKEYSEAEWERVLSPANFKGFEQYGHR